MLNTLRMISDVHRAKWYKLMATGGFVLMQTVLITFDISVNLPLRMKILQPFQYFPQYSSYISLFKRSWAELGRVRGNVTVQEIKIRCARM